MCTQCRARAGGAPAATCACRSSVAQELHGDPAPRAPALVTRARLERVHAPHASLREGVVATPILELSPRELELLGICLATLATVPSTRQAT